ncbi:eukaryotic translation initiation factor 5B-like [Lutzomyia longipalpis]|uniref:eukaryotic translation initiation factor 5B-like n=1 Tax=Lutzomyia longipalpis TaxID=7200 RepID=UPI0024839C4D|nr:eukaryotic translation initiation factor 5B-like [Lutzomyia longipalpis]
MKTYDELVRECTTRELRAKCERRGLPSTGNKDELAKRIVARKLQNCDGGAKLCKTLEKDRLQGKDGKTLEKDGLRGKDGKTLEKDGLQSKDDASNGSQDEFQCSNDEKMRRKPVKERRDQLQFYDVEGSIEEFSGSKFEDVRLWLEEFDDVAEMAGYSSKQRILMCKKFLRGTARNFIFAEGTATSWREMKRMLVDEFGKRISSVEIHRRLSSKKKKDDETYLDYVYEIQRIGKMGNVDESSLCEYVCDGIPGDEMEKIVLYDAKTIRELKMKLERYERQMEIRKKYVEVEDEDEISEEDYDSEEEDEEAEEIEENSDDETSEENDEESEGSDEKSEDEESEVEKSETWVNSIIVEEDVQITSPEMKSEENDDQADDEKMNDKNDVKKSVSKLEVVAVMNERRIFEIAEMEFYEEMMKKLSENNSGPRMLYVDYREINSKIKELW